MADMYRSTGSDGVVERFVDQGAGTGTNYWTRAVSVDWDANSLYPVAPVVTVYSPTGTAYMKVTPDATMMHMLVAPRVVTQTLVYAPNVTHKIADTTTTIAAADPNDLATSITAADEILADTNTHIASLVYHLAAGTAWYAGHKVDDTTNTATADNMSSLATGYVLADELDDDYNAHVVATTFHASAQAAVDFGGTPAAEAALRTKVNLLHTSMLAHFGTAGTAHSAADTINAALVSATTPGSDEATDQTLINLLKTYWNSHCAVGDATHDDLAAVVVSANAGKAGILAHVGSTSQHGGTADAVAVAAVTAGVAATDLATAYALLHVLKDAYNAHCAVLDGGTYVAVPLAGLPLVWDCLGSVWVKTDTSAGVFSTSEFRSA